MLKDFKPTLWFLARFFGAYATLALGYGAFIRAYDTQQPAVVDPFTRWISQQIVGFERHILGREAEIIENQHLQFQSAPEQTYDGFLIQGQFTVSLEEGCNGLAMMYLFASFVFAFGGKGRTMAWFIPAGLVFLHGANLFRLLVLIEFNLHNQGTWFHFFHKYGFTSIIYAAVFGLWVLWVAKLAGFQKKATPA
jgi:exosortase family protein XrtF